MNLITYCFYGIKFWVEADNDNFSVWEDLEEKLSSGFEIIYKEGNDDYDYFLTHKELCWSFSHAYNLNDSYNDFVNISDYFEKAEYYDYLFIEELLKAPLIYYKPSWYFITIMV